MDEKKIRIIFQNLFMISPLRLAAMFTEGKYYQQQRAELKNINLVIFHTLDIRPMPYSDCLQLSVEFV
jgi:hypothetical protein